MQKSFMMVPANISLTSQEIQLHHKPLQFTYRQFLSSNKSLLNLRINKYYITQRIFQQSNQKHIYKAINSQTNQQVAIKMLNLRKIQLQPNQSIKYTLKRLIHSQSRLMMLFDSIHILKCYQCYENVDFKFIILEYCNEGTLQDKINNQNNIQEKQAITILKQIIKGIIQCHKKNVIHRDIKAQNIFINNGICKIADFGFSKQLKNNNSDQLSMNTCLGTLTTMAPQVYQQLPYGLKADIWSIGIILFQMIFGIIPYKANTQQRLIQQMNDLKHLIQTIQQYNGIRPSKKVRDFLCSVLDANVERRLGWKELLGHEILKNQNQENISDNKNQRYIRNKFTSSFLVDVEINQIGQQLFQIEKEYFVSSQNIDIGQFQIKQDKKQLINHKQKKQFKQIQKKQFQQTQKKQFQQQTQKNQFQQTQTIQLKQQQYNLSQSTPTNLLQKPQFTSQNQFSSKIQKQQQNMNSFLSQDYEKQNYQKLINLQLKQQKNQKKQSAKIKIVSVIIKQQNQKNKEEIKLKKEQSYKNQRQIKEEYFIPDHVKQKYSQQLQFQRQKDQQQQKPLTGYFPNVKKQRNPLNIQNQQYYQQQPQVNSYCSNSIPSSQLFLQNSMISRIQESQLLLKKQRVIKQQQQLLKWAQRMHLQCLKTQTIYQNIIQVIQQYQMFDFNKRQIIQMMYLICTRCLNNISPINYQYQKRKNNVYMKSLLSNVQRLHKKVSDKWLYYSNELTKKQNQKINYVLDIGQKWIWNRQQRKIKDKFLTGIQSYQQFKPKSLETQLEQLQQKIQQKQKNKKKNKKEFIFNDYTEEEQIQFTGQIIKNNLKQIKWNQKAKDILNYLKHFKDISRIKVEDLRNKKYQKYLELMLM